MNWRRSEWISVGSIVLIGSLWWHASAKATRWDITVDKVEDKRKGNDALDIRVALMEKSNRDEMKMLNSIAQAVGANRRIRDDE